MTHDPLCPGWFDTLDGQAECEACELIAKVREDQQAKGYDQAVQRVKALAWPSKGLESTFSLQFIVQEMLRQRP